ncbi:MAG: DUF4124 domain-containing protein [bacterium]
MRFHLLTRNLFCSLLYFGLLSLSGVASAQVYKSYDADGNVVFSDKPTQNSSEVEVTKPNVSESFEIPPTPPAEPPPETDPDETEPETEPATQPIADEDSADTNNDGRRSRREKEEQRKERRKKKREKEKAAEGG